MSTCKSIFKNVGKYAGYAILFLCSLVVIGVVAGATWYMLSEHGCKDCDNQFIYGCMSAGLSEEVCKGRVY